MRSFVALGLTLAACAGDPIETSAPIDNPDGEQPLSESPDEPDPEALRVAVNFHHPDCDEIVVAFEIRALRADGSEVANPACRIELAGVVSEDCIGELVVPTTGIHGYKIDITDPETGAVGVEESNTVAVPPLEAELTVARAECGLALTYSFDVRPLAFKIVNITPAEHVVGDAARFDNNATVEVTQPGIYQVELFAEKERGSGTICKKTVTKTVDLTTCVPCGPDEPGEPDEPDHPHD